MVENVLFDQSDNKLYVKFHQILYSECAQICFPLHFKLGYFSYLALHHLPTFIIFTVIIFYLLLLRQWADSAVAVSAGAPL